MLVAPIMVEKRPLIIWNSSSSAPIGLYWVNQKPPGIGDLAVVRLPARTAAFAADRGYLPHSAYLLKPVAAIGGDQVCRHGTFVFVRVAFMAHANPADSKQQPLPRWQGCHILRSGELFLLSHAAESFDGRYFGPIRTENIVGRAALILRGA
jgi:conjugative transfer signal peptidase TraF